MPLTPDQERKVREMLEKMRKDEQKSIAERFESFVRWLRSRAYDIYQSFIDSLDELWYWVIVNLVF